MVILYYGWTQFKQLLLIVICDSKIEKLYKY